MKRAILPLAPLALVALAACSADPAPADPDNTASAPEMSVETPAATPKAPPIATGTPATEAELAEDAATVRDAETVSTIPARFQGRWGKSKADCDDRSHDVFTITGDEIEFFESRGAVQSVKADGDYAAATVDETYVETTRYIFYMALEGADRLRFRYDKGERYTYVRCT